MPQIKSRKKDLRHSLYRRRLNRDRKRDMRLAVRKALEAARSDSEGLDEAVRGAQRAIDLASQKGPLHARTAARKKSRLVRLIARIKSGSE